MNSIVTWAVDVGSIKAGHFGWCRLNLAGEPQTGTDIRELVDRIADDFAKRIPVALGFECPLFVPVTEDPERLTRARCGEGNRPWSAGGGAGSLATGLAEYTWIFEQIRKKTKGKARPTFDWATFENGSANLFIWEAFVSAEAKGPTHAKDAEIAARSFWNAFRRNQVTSAVKAENAFSLVGAALLRAGLSTDLAFLSTPCVVIKSEPGQQPQRGK
jgi:hypothetical protein